MTPAVLSGLVICGATVAAPSDPSNRIAPRNAVSGNTARWIILILVMGGSLIVWGWNVGGIWLTERTHEVHRIKK